MKKKVLFLCTHNSARSQMAEAFLRTYYNAYYESFSAGTNPGNVHPLAIQVMKEIGIDLTNHYSKHLDQFLHENIDMVITVCDHAKEVCPIFPKAKQRGHKSFPDPASIEGTEEERLQVFRSVREEIREWILNEFKIKSEDTPGDFSKTT